MLVCKCDNGIAVRESFERFAVCCMNWPMTDVSAVPLWGFTVTQCHVYVV